jgi:ABC-type nitrate/sulfonate/bicarbonate transport system permease component
MSLRQTTPPSLSRQVIEIVVLCSVVAALWEVLVRVHVWNPTFVASPSRILAAIWDFRQILWGDLIFTFVWILLGFLATVISAGLTAMALHILPEAFSRPIYGVLVILQCVPVFAVVPALAYWTGVGKLTRLIIIVLVAFFPILVNTLDGLRSIDSELIDLFDSMNASKSKKLLLLETPSALQMVIAGLKVTLTLCAIGAVVAEMTIGERIGLGYRPREASDHFRMDEVFAAIILLVIVVLVLYKLLGFGARKLQPWRYHT